MDLTQLASQYFLRNYDYLWLKVMLAKAQSAIVPGSTLITGSSHALNGIDESAWMNAINCSMHSQDIYYDFLCAKKALTSVGVFARCFIVMGYYIAFQDLSLSRISRETTITSVYYPIFHDAHHWDSPVELDLWASLGYGSIPEPVRTVCEQAAMAKVQELGTYYNAFRQRGSYFDLHGHRWAEVSALDQDAMGKYRAAEHNRLFEHTRSLADNTELLTQFVRFLYQKGVTPIVVIPPFTAAYNRYVRQDMKESVVQMLDNIPEDIHYVDFNQSLELFDDEDYMDTDHMSAKGANKVSRILVDMFGK